MVIQDLVEIGTVDQALPITEPGIDPPGHGRAARGRQRPGHGTAVGHPTLIEIARIVAQPHLVGVGRPRFHGHRPRQGIRVPTVDGEAEIVRLRV